MLTAFHTDDGDHRQPLLPALRRLWRAGGDVARAGAGGHDHRRRADAGAGGRAWGRWRRGKDADFIILSGDPLSVYTHVEQTWVEGSKVFDLREPGGPACSPSAAPDVFDGAAAHTHDGEEGH